MADDTLGALADQLDQPGIKISSMFGKPTLKTDAGKAFVCLQGGELACRLGQGTDEHAKALALDGAHLFDPSGQDRPMKDWVSLPPAHADRWTEFAAAALAVPR